LAAVVRGPATSALGSHTRAIAPLLRFLVRPYPPEHLPLPGNIEKSKLYQSKEVVSYYKKVLKLLSHP
jgi:hypothetical protein